jgi:hypothetical protein
LRETSQSVVFLREKKEKNAMLGLNFVGEVQSEEDSEKSRNYRTATRTFPTPHLFMGSPEHVEL